MIAVPQGWDAEDERLAVQRTEPEAVGVKVSVTVTTAERTS